MIDEISVPFTNDEGENSISIPFTIEDFSKPFCIGLWHLQDNRHFMP